MKSKRGGDGRGPAGRFLSLTALLLLTATAGATAQATPHGSQFQVNTITTAGQVYPRVAVGPQGDFVVVWMSYAHPGADVDLSHVAARRFAADGTPLGDEFQVNSSTTGYQSYPDVARAPGGDFVVVWESDASVGDDTDGKSIQAQRFSSTGSPAGSEFQVNTTTTGDQDQPAVAVDAATGAFAVVWEDVSSYAIRARRFDANGLPAGSDFAVPAATDYPSRLPSLGFLAGGAFVVAWTSDGSYGTDQFFRSVQARRFDAQAVPEGDTFQVNVTTTGHQEYPVVVTDGGERFLVAWESDASAGADTSGSSVQAQLFDGNGAVGGELQVNQETTANQGTVAAAMDPQGNVIVSWISRHAAVDPEWSIQGRRIAADGSFLGGEFQVNTYTTGYQMVPGVGTDALGNFVVTWFSDGSAGSDTDSWSVQAQRYDGVFRDDFESGDWSRWTHVMSGLPSS